MMRVLGIESTCDETAAAVVEDGVRVLSSVVATQEKLHAIYKGVVPEIASRAHIENILPVIESALREARTNLNQIDAIAVAHRPGLIGSLLIGLTAAKTLAWATGKPLIGVDHVAAHLYSVFLDQTDDPQSPRNAIGLVCSGGHTAIYHLRSWTDIRLIGKTIDDAVGEAYDKVAAMLGLGYPGGPILDRLAAEGNGQAIDFPRSMLGKSSLDFSFSGLKTSVLYHVRGFQGKAREASTLSESALRDVAASFQAACIDTLLTKLGRAIQQTGATELIIGGGVSANRGLRAALPRLGVAFRTPKIQYCTDNAAMIAGLGVALIAAGRVTSLALDAVTSSEIPLAAELKET